MSEMKTARPRIASPRMFGISSNFNFSIDKRRTMSVNKQREGERDREKNEDDESPTMFARILIGEHSGDTRLDSHWSVHFHHHDHLC